VGWEVSKKNLGVGLPSFLLFFGTGFSKSTSLLFYFFTFLLFHTFLFYYVILFLSEKYRDLDYKMYRG